MPKYMLLLRADIGDAASEGAANPDISPDEMQQVIERYQAWASGLAQAGRLVMGQKLTENGGKVMRREGGDTVAKDGPFVEAKEVVGGFYVVDADSYDHAVELCDDHPNFLFGSIEIREIDFMGGPEEL